MTSQFFGAPKLKCQVLQRPTGDACPRPATFRVVWKDGDVSKACEECVLALRQLAQDHKTPAAFRAEPLDLESSLAKPEA